MAVCFEISRGRKYKAACGNRQVWTGAVRIELWPQVSAGRRPRRNRRGYFPIAVAFRSRERERVDRSNCRSSFMPRFRQTIAT
jgi:hypothetical protein